MANDRIENKDIFGDDAFKKTIEEAKQLEVVLTEIETTLKNIAKTELKNLNKSNSSTVKGIQEQRKSVERLNEAEKITQKLNKQKEQLSQRLKIANSDRVQSNVLLAEQTREQNRLNKATVRETEKVFGAYTNLSTKLNRLRKEAKDLGVQFGTNSKQFKDAQERVLKLDRGIKKLDASLGQSQRSVGNYAKALSGLKNIFGALGLVGGVQLLARAFRDTFTRIIEFDKSMRNLSGVLGKTRSDIKNIEKEIIRVAGSSIKTSREVANLGEVLATMGKRGQDLINLIEPANNLSIALQATSDEAAEFLIQTLNAFGASTTSADEYANTITAIRTSTSLDFQKMRDSFQYITPIARILNKDLAYTGALVGLLADNGLKAESAGRLLGTALQKLAKEGNTLDGALSKISEAQRLGVKEYDLLALASNLFGKQAAKIGIILANNTGVIEKNAQAIRDNNTALEDLTNEQLESLDAKLKILDSTWEKFILNVENGQGSIANFIKGAIDSITGLISFLDEVSDPFGAALNDSLDAVRKLSEETTKSAIKDFKEFLEVNKLTKQTEEERIKTIEKFLKMDKYLAKGLELKKLRNGELSEQDLKQLVILKQRIRTIEGLTEVNEKEIDQQDENNKQLKETITNKQKLEGLNRDEITRLKELKNELKFIEEARERLVTKTDKQSVEAFSALTIQAKELERIIEVYERLLNGEEEVKRKPLNNTKELEELRKQANKDIDDRVAAQIAAEKRLQEFTRLAIQETAKLANQAFENRISQINDELKRVSETADNIRTKAEVSRTLNDESLAFEKKKEAELQQQLQKERKRQQQTQIFFTALEAYQTKTQQGDGDAIGSTFRDIGLIRTLSKSFSGFFHGTDDTGNKGIIADKYGKITGYTHENEMVFNAREKQQLGNRSRKEIIDIVKSKDQENYMQSVVLNGLNKGNAIPKNNFKIVTDKEITKRLEILNDSIKSIELKSDTVEIDSLRNILIHTKNKGNKKVVTRSKLHN